MTIDKVDRQEKAAAECSDPGESKNKSLDNNFVTELNSLLVVIDDGTRNFNAGHSLFYEI